MSSSPTRQPQKPQLERSISTESVASQNSVAQSVGGDYLLNSASVAYYFPSITSSSSSSNNNQQVIMDSDTWIRTTLPTDDPNILRSELKKMRDFALGQHYLIRKLRGELEMECGRVKILRHDNDALKKSAVDLHAQFEREEELVTNRLLKQIQSLNAEKKKIITEMEQEEEFVTNSLQRRLNQLEKEKFELEVQMEQEQEFLVNRLAKQLDESSGAAAKRRGSSHSPYASYGSLHHSPSITLPSPVNSNSSAIEITPDEELRRLRERLSSLEKDHEARLATYQREINTIKAKIQKASS